MVLTQTIQNIDPLAFGIVSISFVILLLSIFLRAFKMPSVVIYILSGVVISYLLHIENASAIQTLGELGLILMMFFVGMDIPLQKLIKGWKIIIGGGILQVLLTLVLFYILGIYLHWAIETIVLMAFVVSMSSTAVVLKILDSNNENHTSLGEKIVGFLIFQDLLLIPMMLVLSFLNNKSINFSTIGIQLFGILAIGLFVWYIIKRDELVFLPKLLGNSALKSLKNNPEMQLFIALGICFGFSLLSGLFGLSTALGSFVAGIVVSKAKETEWVHTNLEPFYVFFIALFFISIGILINVNFIFLHYKLVSVVLIFTIGINAMVNTITFKLLKLNWKDSIYAGVMLSQIGELSFVLIALGLQLQVMSQFTYDLAISVISLSLIITPGLIIITKKILKRN